MGLQRQDRYLSGECESDRLRTPELFGHFALVVLQKTATPDSFPAWDARQREVHETRRKSEPGNRRMPFASGEERSFPRDLSKKRILPSLPPIIRRNRPLQRAGCR